MPAAVLPANLLSSNTMHDLPFHRFKLLMLSNWLGYQLIGILKSIVNLHYMQFAVDLSLTPVTGSDVNPCPCT